MPRQYNWQGMALATSLVAASLPCTANHEALLARCKPCHSVLASAMQLGRHVCLLQATWNTLTLAAILITAYLPRLLTTSLLAA